MASFSGGEVVSVSSTEDCGEESKAQGGGESEESKKEALIGKILELQNTLHDLTQRVNSVKEENSKLKSENEILNQYIENLMVTSGTFKSSDGKK